jgi:hypothetical protein
LIRLLARVRLIKLLIRGRSIKLLATPPLLFDTFGTFGIFKAIETKFGRINRSRFLIKVSMVTRLPRFSMSSISSIFFLSSCY